jgi:hypothetical protein
LGTLGDFGFAFLPFLCNQNRLAYSTITKQASSSRDQSMDMGKHYKTTARQVQGKCFQHSFQHDNLSVVLQRHTQRQLQGGNHLAAVSVAKPPQLQRRKPKQRVVGHTAPHGRRNLDLNSLCRPATNNRPTTACTRPIKPTDTLRSAENS